MVHSIVTLLTRFQSIESAILTASAYFPSLISAFISSARILYSYLSKISTSFGIIPLYLVLSLSYAHINVKTVQSGVSAAEQELA